ncbi:hypothetical protein Q5P01_004974 [Channa striata]|uniref:Pro-opiomelanocortin/corticotropin ACTH central region domain-containing protein n=1 Tax=Channa striata TaxID=64152 RepID=A0AA88SYZ7_CHASR|nr:hypothetical protein Q5P01_004974 [Channa striata]
MPGSWEKFSPFNGFPGATEGQREGERQKERLTKSGLKMVCLCWIIVVVMAYVCVPGFGSLCRDSYISNDLSSQGRILDCIHLCLSVMQNKLPELGALGLKVDRNDDLLLCITLATLAFKDKLSEPEGGDASEGSFPPLARRQLSEKAPRALTGDSPPNQRLKRMKVSLKTSGPVSHQDRKDGTYQMSHFRWGGPPASKRSDAFVKPWEREPQGPLVSVFRNIIVKDVQRVMGQMGGRDEEEGGLV